MVHLRGPFHNLLLCGNVAEDQSAQLGIWSGSIRRRWTANQRRCLQTRTRTARVQRTMRTEEYFVDPWNVFDYCLVVFSVADLEPWQTTGHSETFSGSCMANSSLALDEPCSTPNLVHFCIIFVSERVSVGTSRFSLGLKPPKLFQVCGGRLQC